MTSAQRIKQYLGKASFSSEVDRYSALECVAEIETEMYRLIEELEKLEVCANTVYRCYTHRPENFAIALRDMADCASEARKFIDQGKQS